MLEEQCHWTRKQNLLLLLLDRPNPHDQVDLAACEMPAWEEIVDSLIFTTCGIFHPCLRPTFDWNPEALLQTIATGLILLTGRSIF